MNVWSLSGDIRLKKSCLIATHYYLHNIIMSWPQDNYCSNLHTETVDCLHILFYFSISVNDCQLLQLMSCRCESNDYFLKVSLKIVQGFFTQKQTQVKPLYSTFSFQQEIYYQFLQEYFAAEELKTFLTNCTYTVNSAFMTAHCIAWKHSNCDKLIKTI